MSRIWLERHVSKAVNYAGPRYTPALNVPVATSAAFDGLARDEEFFTRVYEAQREIRKCHTNCTFDYQGSPELLEPLATAFASLESLLVRVTPSEFPLPLSDLGSVASSLERLAREARHRLLGGESRHSTYWLGELAAASMSLREVCEEPAARLANNPFMLLSGSGGSGKTHLICDIAVQRAKRGAITLVFFGDRLCADDVWAQMLGSLGLPISTSDDLLGRLNESGEGSGQRSLIVFDAINEGSVRSGWRRAARQIIHDVGRYPSVGVCFAIRAGFEPAVLDEDLVKLLVKVDHPGFGEREWDAVEAYFHEYHLPLPEIPLVADEFQNPLFLKLFCEAFRGSKRSFRGHYGATHVFEAYAKECGKRVGRNLGVTGQSEFVWKRVLKPCAEWMGRKGAAEIPMVEVAGFAWTAEPSS